VIDFAGSAGVHAGNLNATPAVVHSAVIYVLRLLIGESLPLNEGLMRAVELRIPPGILNPPFDPDPARCPAVVGATWNPAAGRRSPVEALALRAGQDRTTSSSARIPSATTRPSAGARAPARNSRARAPCTRT
jgi:hypothetical protein